MTGPLTPAELLNLIGLLLVALGLLVLWLAWRVVRRLISGSPRDMASPRRPARGTRVGAGQEEK